MGGGVSFGFGSPLGPAIGPAALEAIKDRHLKRAAQKAEELKPAPTVQSPPYIPGLAVTVLLTAAVIATLFMSWHFIAGTCVAAVVLSVVFLDLHKYRLRKRLAEREKVLVQKLEEQSRETSKQLEEGFQEAYELAAGLHQKAAKLQCRVEELEVELEVYRKKKRYRSIDDD